MSSWGDSGSISESVSAPFIYLSNEFMGIFRLSFRVGEFSYLNIRRSMASWRIKSDPISESAFLIIAIQLKVLW